MLLPDLSAFLSLKQPLKQEVTSAVRRAGGDGKVGECGNSSTLSGVWKNLGWRGRRDWRRGPARLLDRNRLDSQAADNGIL